MDEAEQSHAMQQLLVASIGAACHELRSPLAVVYGFARMLEQHEDDPAIVHRYVGHVVGGSERIDELLELLSRMGRIAARRTVPTRERVMAHTIVDAAREELAIGAAFDVAAVTDAAVSVDPTWARDALCDLVRGIRYDDAFGVRVRVDMHADHVVFSVSMHDTQLPLAEIGAGESSLRIALARMRALAIGGSIEPVGTEVELRLPRHHA